MARYEIGVTKTTGAAAGLLVQLRAASTTRDLRVTEVGVFASTAVSGEVALVRPSAVGSGFTSSSTGAALDNVSGTGAAVVDTAATTPPTIGTNYMRRIVLPASIGAGVIWTWPTGIVVPASGGLVLQQLSTAAVTYAVYFSYDE
jgi:hypothetical protein